MKLLRGSKLTDAVVGVAALVFAVWYIWTYLPVPGATAATVFLLYEVYALVNDQPDDTISETIWRYSDKSPLVPAAGFGTFILALTEGWVSDPHVVVSLAALCGHFWFPRYGGAQRAQRTEVEKKIDKVLDVVAVVKPKEEEDLKKLLVVLVCAFLSSGASCLKNLPTCKITGCPPGTHCYCEDGCICTPDVIPMPSPSPTIAPAPSPSPKPSPASSPSPSSSPSPHPSPASSPSPAPSPTPTPPPSVECDVPQVPNDRWELINYGCEAGGPCPAHGLPALDPMASLLFMPQQPDPPAPPRPSVRDDLIEQAVRAIERESGCVRGTYPCFAGDAKTAHNAIARRLRANGLCAGLDYEEADHVFVSTNPPLLGLWLEVHEICGGPSIWCWGNSVGQARGKIGSSSALWRIRG